MKDPDPRVALSTTPALRKKATGVRTWLLLDSMSQTQVVEAGKYAIMRRTGLPARDLRVLDPLLSYPSTLLGREKAIVINLEHIKAIIMAKEVLVLNSKDPFVRPFVEELQKRISCRYQAIKDQDCNGDDENVTSATESQKQQSQLLDPQQVTQVQNQDQASKTEGKKPVGKQEGSKVLVLPFEFVALEACLEAACSSLETEARTLELEAHPALDKLTSQISALNLDSVRQIKSRLVAITGRVQKIRDELEHLLDDDQDMAEMYLTDKLVQRNLESSSTSSSADEFDMDHDGEIPGDSIEPCEADVLDNNDSEDELFSARNALGNDSHRTNHSISVTKKLDVGELEMLLEAYFVQIDATLNKLSTLREYVDDTEDYINIMLDDKQNQLLQMGVMLTTATLVATIFIVVTGILGMNIRIHLFLTDVQIGMPKWLWTTFSGTAGVIIMYIMAIAWYKHKGYID